VIPADAWPRRPEGAAPFDRKTERYLLLYPKDQPPAATSCSSAPESTISEIAGRLPTSTEQPRRPSGEWLLAVWRSEAVGTGMTQFTGLTR
jgi:hypothetical protein